LIASHARSITLIQPTFLGLLELHLHWKTKFESFSGLSCFLGSQSQIC